MAQKDIAAQILELAIDLRESIPKGSESASAWMTKAREFVDTCIINGHLSDELLTIISIKERGGFIGLLKNIQHASGSYNTGLSTSIDNNLATIIKVLKDVAKLESRHNFSVASLSELRNNLTSVQKKLFDEIWNLYVSSGSGFLLRNLPSIVEKQPMKDIFKGLNGSLINDTKEQNDTVFKLTVYGALLTVKGPALASLLVRLLDFVKERYESNSSTTELNKEQIKIGLDLSDNETQILFRLLTLYLPPGMPISISSYQTEGRDWQIRIPDVELIHFINFEGTLAFLDDRLSAGYRPEQPFPSDQGLMTQHVQGVSFSNLNPDISVGVTGVEATGSVSGIPTDDTSDRPNQHPGSSPLSSASSALSSTRTEAEAESDLLDREKLTLALYHLLTEREDEHPFAIGLFGHWGTGKSSQINFLQEKLKKAGNPKIQIAEFNAWQNEKSTNLAAMLAQAVVDGLIAEKSMRQRLILAVRLAALRHSHTREAIEQGWRFLSVWLPCIWVLLPTVVWLILLALLLLWIPSNGGMFVVFFKGLGWTAAMLVSVFHFMRSHLTEWFNRLDIKKSLSLLSLPDYSAHRGLILDIHRTLRDLCSLCLTGKSPKEGSYLLLVVDDLDRCEVDKVKDVLDAIRLVANIPRVVTLVAMDERMAYAAVEKHYHQFGHAGRPPALVARDYLAKVLQISVTLPEVNQDAIESFVDKKIFSDVGLPPMKSTAGASLTVHGETPKNQNGEKSTPSLSASNENALPIEVAKIVLEQTPSSQSQITPTADQIPPRQSSLPEEKDLFKHLAQAYDFSNPRLLWRQYMAWKLLKSLTLDTTYNIEDVEVLMQLLFWREWTHQLTYEQREVCSNWMEAAGQYKPKEITQTIFDEVKLKLRPYWERAMPLIKVVDAVLLPSNQSEAVSDGELQK